MEEKKKYDIIIIGAGLSGLTLASEFSKKKFTNVLVLEKKKKFFYDKNWCFWNEPPNQFTSEYDNAWENIAIKIDGQEIVHRNHDIKYLHIKSSTFYKRLSKELKLNKIEIKMNQNIKEIINSKDGHTVLSNNKRYRTKLIFDSRPDFDNENDGYLYQHFYGVEVNFKDSLLDHNKVMLMDFQNFQNGINFFYILPFSKKKALFETTYFSSKILGEKEYRSDIKKYLKINYPNKIFSYKFIEKGVIPMFLKKTRKSTSLIKIGTSGNWVKISTGYSFQNSFINSKDIVNKFIYKKELKIKKNVLNEFLDKTFCFYIKNYSEDSKHFFKCFFYKNDIKNIVSFLVGKASLIQVLRIILTLPKVRLIISAFKVLKESLVK